MKTIRLMPVMTFMSVFAFAASLYGQQEVDPTWYDPWPEANKASAHSIQPQVPKDKLPVKFVSAVLKAQPEKLHTSLAVRHGHDRTQSVPTASTEQADLGMPSKRDLSLTPVADEQQK